MRVKARILVVEGETPVAMLMVHLLTRTGFEVRAAHKGQKGMELAAEVQFDLIVLGTNLSGVGGFEVCRELRQRHISRRTPIIFISSQMSEADKQRSLDLGAQDYITKPFEADDFIFRVTSLLKNDRPNTVQPKAVEGIKV